jgi:hypothetical protein
MKERIFIFDIIEKETGKKIFPLEVIGKTEQGARAKLNKAYYKKELALANIAWGVPACMPYHFFKAELVKVLDF